MENSIELRPLRARDYPDAVQVYRQSPRFVIQLNGRAPESVTTEMVEEEAAQAAYHGGSFEGIFLSQTGEMIGIVSVVPKGFKGVASNAWIGLLLIAEPHQRKGYATRAWRLIEERVWADSEVRTIGLGVLVNNGPALGFWTAMGFQRQGSTVPDGDGREVMIMKKERGWPERGAQEEDGGEGDGANLEFQFPG